MNCPFCDQLNIRKQLLAETATEYVLYNIRKTNKGRCLVIPKRHVRTIRDLTDKELQGLMRTVQWVSEKLNSYLHPAGINYGFNEGGKAGQEIDHFHFHILPRYENDIVPEFHIFHHNRKLRQNYPDEEFRALVKEFQKIFRRKKRNKL